MHSPLTWIGGKRRLAKAICERIPKHKAYVEPFTGAGWVFFNKPPSPVETLNDVNGDLVSFWRIIQRHPAAFLEQFKHLLVGRETFEDFKNQLETPGYTDVERAARFYYIQRCAFGGKLVNRTFGVSPLNMPRINLLRIEEEISQVHLRLARVLIERLHYADCLRRYDKPEVLFYIDPPYWACEKDYGVAIFTREDHAHLAELLKNLEHAKFVLSYNDVPEIAALYADMRIERVETRYSVGKHVKVNELLISN